MFQGAHPYRIDEKGRLKMPAEFLDDLGARFTITRGNTRGCLWVMPQSEWDPLVARVRGESIMDPRALGLQRWFVGSSVATSLDGQGRLTLPPVLREWAGIQHEVMVVGIGPRIELWARETWDAYDTQMTDELIEELARSAGI